MELIAHPQKASSYLWGEIAQVTLPLIDTLERDASASYPNSFYKKKHKNCAEIWAVRDAILQGAKIENLVLRSVTIETGLVKAFCKNCRITFGDFMNSMD